MSFGTLETKNPPTNIDQREFVVVAVSRDDGIAFIVDFEGFCIGMDKSEGGLDAEEMGLGPSESGSGLWIGEGIPVWEPGYVEGYPSDAEGEMTYNNFTWRRMTYREFDLLNKGELWGHREHCHDCGQYLKKDEGLILETNKHMYCTRCYQRELREK